ncbi:DExH-box ATP-dependent RNA helicase DExH15 chloroplastic-like isoform X2 [Rosa rugosa]|uniref:DExH-box ATP-dependent RNA helicase DExH15 chloroplastic-like isoform X2 n=1 Tax=Rosa rugosa TaxID=74645 RepID=UPI002B41799C|nr:DExH-box ATP-dependent RNA helicase DExH15 chloroplastic-like isoform X2 [Rosa rugosa]
MFDGLEQSDDEIEMESSVADAELVIRDEEFRWQRVEKLCEDVKQFGEEMIDDGSLASIYDFRIDKFQSWLLEMGRLCVTTLSMHGWMLYSVFCKKLPEIRIRLFNQVVA